MENISNIVEAIIFTSGSAIAKSAILEKIPELSGAKLNSIIKELQKKYSGESGVLLQEFNNKIQFVSNPKYGDIVADVLEKVKEKELTRTLLEVLATIAYKQPITRVEIDDMRGGTSSEYAITGLLKAGLIEPVGKKDSLGHPILYATTDTFLKKFQIENLSYLPDYDEVYEKLKLISLPDESDELFKTRVFINGDEIIEQQEMIEANIDATKEDFGEEEDEIPDFLMGEDIEVID